MSEQRMEQVSEVAGRQQGELSGLRKLSARIFKGGAVLTCPICGRTKEKTEEEMAKYMKRWPRCCSHPAEVEIK